MYRSSVLNCDIEQIRAEIDRALVERYSLVEPIWDRLHKQYGLLVNATQFAKIFSPSFNSSFTKKLEEQGLLHRLIIKGTTKCYPISEAERIYKLWVRGGIKLNIKEGI